MTRKNDAGGEHARKPLLLLALIAGFETLQAVSAWADGDALHVEGYVRDHEGNPVIGIAVIGDDYVGGVQTSITDTNGFYEIASEPEVNFRVQVSCDQLLARGFVCVRPATVTLSADDIRVDFIIHPRPVLSAPRWRTNGFSMLLTGATNQYYTIQMSTDPGTTNWTSLFVTNNPNANCYLVVDPHATNRARFYRVWLGP